MRLESLSALAERLIGSVMLRASSETAFDERAGVSRDVMLKSFLLAAGLTLVSSTTSAQDPTFSVYPRMWRGLIPVSRFDAAVEKVRSLDRMTYRVGFGMTPGEFFRLSEECLHSGTIEDFNRLLTDRAPLVRVMGLIGLAHSVARLDLAKAAAALKGDTAVIIYTNGCVPDQTTTVADLARSLAADQFYLGVVGRRR